MPRRRFGGRSRVPRRKMVWARTQGTLTIPVGAAALLAPARTDALLEFEQSLGASTVGATVVRTRGYCVAVDEDAAAGESVRLRVTMYVGNNNEVTRGPDAGDNAFDLASQNKDYFFMEPFHITSPGTQAAVGGADPHSRMIDVKSSRKIEELNQTVILDGSGQAIALAANINVAVAFDLSMLLMLP